MSTAVRAPAADRSDTSRPGLGLPLGIAAIVLGRHARQADGPSKTTVS